MNTDRKNQLTYKKMNLILDFVKEKFLNKPFTFKEFKEKFDDDFRFKNENIHNILFYNLMNGGAFRKVGRTFSIIKEGALSFDEIYNNYILLSAKKQADKRRYINFLNQGDEIFFKEPKKEVKHQMKINKTDEITLIEKYHSMLIELKNLISIFPNIPLSSFFQSKKVNTKMSCVLVEMGILKQTSLSMKFPKWEWVGLEPTREMAVSLILKNRITKFKKTKSFEKQKNEILENHLKKCDLSFLNKNDNEKDAITLLKSLGYRISKPVTTVVFEEL